MINKRGFFMSLLTTKRIAVIGREKQTLNYRKALDFFHAEHEVTLSIGKLSEFDALLLPGGGDIDPRLINEPDQGSRSIDTELDIIQFQALDLFVKNKKPVLGICKGFQLTGLYFGGKLIQDLPVPSIHPLTERKEDAYHEVHSTALVPPPYACRSAGELPTVFPPFPARFTVNSAHHQGICKNGKQLLVFQTAPDGITEAFLHETLPILAFQWHPERMLLSGREDYKETGRLAFEFFLDFFLS